MVKGLIGDEVMSNTNQSSYGVFDNYCVINGTLWQRHLL